MSHLITEDNPVLEPEGNKEYIIKAQGTIIVDFSQNVQEPTLGVESNTIDFGHNALKAKVDSRGLTQMIIDFFQKYIWT